MNGSSIYSFRFLKRVCRACDYLKLCLPSRCPHSKTRKQCFCSFSTSLIFSKNLKFLRVAQYAKQITWNMVITLTILSGVLKYHEISSSDIHCMMTSDVNNVIETILNKILDFFLNFSPSSEAPPFCLKQFQIICPQIFW